MRKVLLLKAGNRLLVDPTTPRIRDLLTPHLSFSEKIFLHGWDRKKAKREGHPIFYEKEWECFGADHRGRLGTYYGFYRRIMQILRKHGYDPVIRDMTPHKNPQVFEPQWHLLDEFGIKLRYGQAEFLQKFFAHRCGRFDCPPGFGKSFAIGLICILLPQARIDIVSKRVPVLRDRIFQELRGMMLDPGIVGGARNITNRRIMCYTAGSISHATGKSDILIGDECHELVTDKISAELGIWSRSRNYGLSASNDLRLDNKDLRAEGIFGPIIYTMDYAEAEANKLVVPLEVFWHPVNIGYDVCEGTDDVEKKRLGIWTNDFRNDLIAKVAKQYDDDTQVLITTETIEHAVHLKQRLPDFALVYAENGMSDQDRYWYIKNQFLDPKEPHMSLERKLRLTHAFETKRLKKAICTTCWNVGVSFNHLQVLIRADGGGSPINDVQIPGRVSRIHRSKNSGIIHDFLDEFNDGLHQKAMGRKRNYARHNWQQHLPGKHSDKLVPGQQYASLPGQKTLFDESEEA